jgi:hypothetical protein
MSFSFQLKVYIQRIDKQIELILIELNQKKGVFLRTHTFTIDEILKSDSFGKLHSIAEKISDDISSWNQAGKIKDNEFESYLEFDNELRTRLDFLYKQIKERKKTIWEQIKGPINEFFDIFWSILPGFMKTLSHAILPPLPRDIKTLPESKYSRE